MKLSNKAKGTGLGEVSRHRHGAQIHGRIAANLAHRFDEPSHFRLGFESHLAFWAEAEGGFKQIGFYKGGSKVPFKSCQQAAAQRGPLQRQT